jgi:uncharacterized phiE125 gp8 family phage protein
MRYPDWNLTRGAVDANTEAISLGVARAHLKIEGTAWDSENTAVQALCTAARQQCELHTNRALAVSTYTKKLAGFPCGNIVLPVGAANVANVSVTYTDANGESQTLATNAYSVLQRTDSFPEIERAYATSWPATRPQSDAVTVTFTAGASTVSDALKAGMLLFITHLYENRSGVVIGTIATELPLGVEALWSDRLIWL